MAKVKQVDAKIVPTEIPYRRGARLLGCFVPGESNPKASHRQQVLEIIAATAKELKELGEEPTPENYAKHLRMKNNLPVVKNALLFCKEELTKPKEADDRSQHPPLSSYGQYRRTVRHSVKRKF